MDLVAIAAPQILAPQQQPTGPPAPPRYQSRNPRTDPLYQVLLDHLETFLAH